MDYRIKEVFYSLQGEGYHSGRSAVFCRFSAVTCGRGKNLIAIKQSVNFATRIFWGRTDREEESTQMQANSQTK